MGRPSRFSPEVRERAIRMVLEQQEKHDSQWAAITSIVEKIGCTAEMGVAGRAGCRPAARADDGGAGGAEAARELRAAPGNEILRKASAYFAQAELDRRAKG